jgi:hypothetical protein
MATAIPRMAGRGRTGQSSTSLNPAAGRLPDLPASELPQVTILRGEHVARALGRDKKQAASRNETRHRKSEGYASVRPGASELNPEA